MSDAALATIRMALDRVADAGGRVPLWWRDDDAVRDSPELDRLLASARAARMPVALAVIPALLEPSLPARLDAEPGTRVLVHGWRHANHAPTGEKPAEFGSHRPCDEVTSELASGRETVRSAFGELGLDVFVPPWNRIGPEAIACLAGAGYVGLSTFGLKRGTRPLGVVTADTHIDPIDWRGTRSLASPELVAAALERDLACRLGSGRDAPMGLLTHHLVMDERVWSFCAALVETMLSHPAVYRAELDRLWRIGDLTSTENSAMIGQSRARDPR